MVFTEFFYKFINNFGFIPLLFFKKVSKNTYLANNNVKIKLRIHSWDPFFLWSFFGRKNETDIEPDDIILDIGAQIGPFTLYAADKARNGLVLAFEPEVQNFKLLQENVKINKFKNVKIFKKAVTGKNGKTTLNVSGLNSGGHSIFPVDGNRKIEVYSINLGKIISDNKLKKIDFVKINAEGAEFDILLKAPPTVFERIDKFLIECHDFLSRELNHKDLSKRLKEEGFSVREKGFWFGIRMGSIVAEKLRVK